MIGTDDKEETDVVAEGAPDAVASATPSKSEMAMAETPDVAPGEKCSLIDEVGNEMEESPPKKEKAAADAEEKAAGAEAGPVETA